MSVTNAFTVTMDSRVTDEKEVSEFALSVKEQILMNNCSTIRFLFTTPKLDGDGNLVDEFWGYLDATTLRHGGKTRMRIVKLLTEKSSMRCENFEMVEADADAMDLVAQLMNIVNSCLPE